MRIRRMLISYVQLDHTLYSINYGTLATVLRSPSRKVTRLDHRTYIHYSVDSTELLEHL